MAGNAECLAHALKEGQKALSKSYVRIPLAHALKEGQKALSKSYVRVPKLPSLGSESSERKDGSLKRAALENVPTACRATLRPKMTTTTSHNDLDLQRRTVGEVRFSTPQPQRRTVGEARISTPRIRRQEPAETVVFLDIDGVLHSLYGDDLFKDRCCQLLSLIIRTTNASIVLSSTWRTEASKVAIINNVLLQLGLSQIYASTKFLDVPREVEICEWLDEHPNVCRWIAIDDMDLMRNASVQSRRMHGHFVRTSSQEGLTDANAQLAIRLLLSQNLKRQAISAAESNDKLAQHVMESCKKNVVSALVSPRLVSSRSTHLDKRNRDSGDDTRRDSFTAFASTICALSRSSPLYGKQVKDGAGTKQLDSTAGRVSPLPSFRRLVKVVQHAGDH